MTEYLIKISGAYYAANGDSVAGQKDTEEGIVRTRQMLSWVREEKPLVVLAAEPTNYLNPKAVTARARGRRIGRVADECLDIVHGLLAGSPHGMMTARVEDVLEDAHGFVMVKVSADNELQSQTQKSVEIEWGAWMSDSQPLLPPSEPLEAELEATYMLDTVLLPNIAEVDFNELKEYVEIWMRGSRHDLSREARQARSRYIEILEAAQSKEVRLLAAPLKEQRTSICGRKALNERCGEWWQQQLNSIAMQRLWQQWKVRNEGRLWSGLQQIDTLLTQLPGELYNDIGELDVILGRLYYMSTPRQALHSIMAMLMLREITCRELGVEMRPMTDEEYRRGSFIENPLDIPTTIGRVLTYAKTLNSKSKKQTIEELCKWLNEEFQQECAKETDELSSNIAKKYWKRLQKAGFVDAARKLLPDTSRQQAMYIAEAFAEKLELRAKWKPFQDLWEINNLAQEKNKFMETGKSPSRSKEIDKIFDD